MIATEFQPCFLRNYESLLQVIMCLLCCSFLMLSISFLSTYYSIALSHPESLFKPEVDHNAQSSVYNPQHWPEFPIFFPLLSPLHCCFFRCCPVPKFPLSLSSFLFSLQLSFSSKWTKHIRWFCYFFKTALSAITIFTALHLFVRISLCENTCMQGGCFQGYRRGTK